MDEKNRFFLKNLCQLSNFFFLHFLLVHLQTVTVINLNFLVGLFQIKIMASRALASEHHRYSMRYRKAAILFKKKK